MGIYEVPLHRTLKFSTNLNRVFRIYLVIQRLFNMEKEIKITGCYHSCSFFGNSMDGMQCNHPYWKDKGAYENMIITQDNSRDGKIPEECPLKNEQLTIVYKLDIS